MVKHDVPLPPLGAVFLFSVTYLLIISLSQPISRILCLLYIAS